MDARPFRPARQGNENLVPSTKQTIHQHHKSAGSLLSMASNGNLKGAAAKRNALADSSNTKSMFPVSATGALGKKNDNNMRANTLAISKAQENNEDQAKPKDALSRPAQRPLSRVSSIAQPLNAVAQIKSLALEPQGQRSAKQQTFKRNSKSIIYNDAQSEKPYQVSEGLKAGATKNAGAININKTGRSTSNAEVEPVLRQPRHYQSQPVLKSTQPPTLRNQPANLKSTAIRKSDPHAMLPPAERERIRPQNGWDFRPDPVEKIKRPDDDVNEAPYLDAVEELPQEVNYPVPASIDEPLVPIPSLPEPIVPTKAYVKSEVKAVDFQPLPPAQADEHAELSDYDDDYYDDQGYTTAHSNRGDNTTGATTIIFPPKLTKKDATELEAAKKIVDSKRTPEEDAEEAWDVSMVSEYGDDIFNYMRQLEMTMLPNAHYMDIQTEIQWSMRSVLMDWVIQVHCRFGLLPETLFLTVNYIDRFLSYKIVSLGKLQLVGATAIFVAAKYEEINCPSVQEIVYMVDNGYSIDEILKAERFMLSMLNFELGWPGPMSFLRRISKADDYDLESRTLSKYFLEVTLMDERFVASPPSYIAAGAHCLSRLILEKGEWTPDHVHYSGYTFAQLRPLVSMILDCCRIARKHHAAVFEKYSDRKYKRVSTFVEGQLHKGFRLPFQSAPTQLLPYNYWDDDTNPVYYPAHQGLKMPIPTEV